MVPDSVDTLVIGAGQAGLAMSEHLGRRGIAHLVVERHRIAERWRSERWDSLVANGPAWHDRFPGMEFSTCGPDDFPTKEAVADYFEAYAAMLDAPIRCGVEVTEVTPASDGFTVTTTAGTLQARNVVVATGPFQKPVIPALVPEGAGFLQMHSTGYRNPDQLPPGGVLVVGSGSSGTQIADELNRAGRKVFLSVGPHDRPMRRYRGKDFVWWLGRLGKWDLAAPIPGMEHVTIAVSGAYGGRTIDFRNLVAEGMTLLGRSEAFDGRHLQIADDLAANIHRGDSYYLALLDEADAYVAREGLDFPAEPEARRIGPDPDCVTTPIRSLDLEGAGVSTIIWATGFQFDFGWLKVGTFDEKGRPDHHKGVSPVPGLYFLGLPWLARRGSSFIWGCWQDAEHLADHMLARREDSAN